jgi:hypothetical protein
MSSDDPSVDPPPIGEPPGVEQGRSRRTWLIAGLAVVVLAVGGFVGAKVVSGGKSNATTASAQNPGQGGPGAGGRGGGRGTFGTLQSVDGPTLTVATRNGNTTVVTSSSTRFAKAVTGAVSDIEVGDRISARGTADGTNVAAERITDSGTTDMGFGGFGGGGGGQGRRPGGNAPPSSVPGGTRPVNGTFAVGTVKTISGSTLTVAQNDGTTKTVTTSASTVVSIVKSSSLQDLTTGQMVTVQGKTNSDGTVTATAVEEGLGGFGPGRGGPGGAGGPGGPPAAGTSSD